MKNIIKIIVSIAFISFLNSCSDFDEINESPNDVSELSPNFLMSTNTRNVANLYSEFGYWGSRVPSLMQYYQVGDSYKADELNALLWEPGESSPWESIYSSLVDVQAMSDLSKEEGNVFLEAVALVYRAILIDLVSKIYGDAPFSEINQLDEGLVFPKYDSQKEIYETLLVDLKTAKNMIEGIPGSEVPVLDGYDLLYDGDKSKWVKFVNSLRIRMCLLLNNKKGELGINLDSEFQDAAQNVFTSSEDNARLEYIGNSEGTSFRGGPFRASELTYARRMGNGFLNLLRDRNDPRLYRWLRPVENHWVRGLAEATTIQHTDPLGQTFPINNLPYPDGFDDLDTSLYVGLPIGSAQTFITYNAGGDGSVEPKTSPYVSRLSEIYFQNANDLVAMEIITYSEVEFILAEAGAIGAFGVSDAESHYKMAIEASMVEWEIFDDYVGGFDFDEYYNQESVDLSKSDNVHKTVMTQKYISMFFRPEPWFDWRRTGYPDLERPVDSDQPVLPIRYHYDTPNPPDPQYIEEYSKAVENLERTEYANTSSNDDIRSKMWLLQGTDKPY